MLQAQLRGKLRRDQENLEDLLTSSVFGSLMYTEGPWLWAFLARADSFDTTSTSLAALLPRGPSGAHMEFWPWIEQPGCDACEPDVLIRLTGDDGRRLLVLVEAKYRSGISSVAGDSEDRASHQLAREWQNLVSLAGAADAAIVYLTSDVVPPWGDIREAQRELKQIKAPPGRFYWLSWRHLPGALSDAASPMLRDLREVIRRRYGLRFFEGVRPVATHLHWRFAPGFSWLASGTVRRIAWRFEGG